MPELPEVETICRALRPQILQRPINKVSVWQENLRWPITPNLATTLTGSAFSDISRRAKYLLLHTPTGTMIVHLGFTGALRFLETAQPKLPHEHLTIYFADQCTLRFTDSRRFGAILWTKEDPLEHKLLIDLGPEPLTEEFTGLELARRCKNHKTPIKQLVMDSHIVAGIGNIYANEALFLAKISPFQPAQSLTFKQYDVLVEAIKNVLTESIAKGGSSIRDYVHSDGKSGSFQNEHKVYGREGLACYVCNTKIISDRLGQRGTFYCQNCQKRYKQS
ncbi:MAG: bifunctional DNA-formamidopyrimidine glycosylase/DNA-(apurinic or apyrimidinic site) lyase [Gammaproteobacteria bacterium]